MCDYQENIEAADKPWPPGTVVMHVLSGNEYTILGNDRFYYHNHKRVISSVSTVEHFREHKDKFVVVA